VIESGMTETETGSESETGKETATAIVTGTGIVIAGAEAGPGAATEGAKKNHHPSFYLQFTFVALSPFQ